MKFLIVNADDFGYSRGINRGIVEAHNRGIVTSATTIVNAPATEEAVRIATENPGLSVGLHVNFTNEGERLVEFNDPELCRGELRRQFDRFVALFGRLPTHLDSHQHVHSQEPLRSVLVATATALRVPLRHETPAIRYCGSFYGQTAEGSPQPQLIAAEALVRIVRGLGDGTTELACHPGYAADLDTMYRSEHEREIDALCDPRVSAAIAELGITLCSFAEVANDEEPRP